MDEAPASMQATTEIQDQQLQQPQQNQTTQQTQQPSVQQPSIQEAVQSQEPHQESSAQMPLPMQTSIQESPVQPQELKQPQELNEESVDTVEQNVESAAPVTPADITDNAESKDKNNSADKPAPAIEALSPVDSTASDVTALVQELRTEVAVLKERNAVLSHKLETLKKAMQQLLS